MLSREGLQIQNGAVIPLLTVKQVAEYTAVSEGTVRKWVADGVLPATRPGRRGGRGRIRIRAADLDEMLVAARTVPAPTTSPSFRRVESGVEVLPPTAFKHLRFE